MHRQVAAGQEGSCSRAAAQASACDVATGSRCKVQQQQRHMRHRRGCTASDAATLLRRACCRTPASCRRARTLAVVRILLFGSGSELQHHEDGEQTERHMPLLTWQTRCLRVKSRKHFVL